MSKLLFASEIKSCIRNPEEIFSKKDTIDSFVEIHFSFKIVFTIMRIGEGGSFSRELYFSAGGNLAEKTFNVNYIFHLMPWIYRFFL